MTGLRFFKTALPEEEAQAVRRRADFDGVSVSAYLRAALARDVNRATVAQTMAAIRALLAGMNKADDPALQEVLALVRLIAARADPQGAARVTAAFKNQSA